METTAIGCHERPGPASLGHVENLYRRYRSLVMRRAFAILGDQEAARDATQDIFVRVLRSIGGFRGEASPTTWLYGVTTNHCLNVIRDRDRRLRLMDERGRPADAPHAPSAEDRLAVSELLRRLPEELSAIAVYYFVDRMSLDEIAALLDISPRTVGNRLDEFRQRARGLMRRGATAAA